MREAHPLEEFYGELLRIVIRQRRALERGDVEGLEALTKEKEKHLSALISAEEAIDSGRKKMIDSKLQGIREKVVKEDKAFILSLREKERRIIMKMGEVKEAKGNLKNIGSAYGKKFTALYSSFDKEC